MKRVFGSAIAGGASERWKGSPVSAVEAGVQPFTSPLAGQFEASLGSQAAGLASTFQYAPQRAMTQPFQKSSPLTFQVPTAGA